MASTKTVCAVLFSGGMDSTYLLHLAEKTFDEVVALYVVYGGERHNELPQGRAQRHAAEQIARELGVIFHLLYADSLESIPPYNAGTSSGINTANVPARNHVFIAMATAFCGARWGDAAAVQRGEGVEARIYLGATHDDQMSFPDCAEGFVHAASVAARESLRGILDIRVKAPLASYLKYELLVKASRKMPQALEDMVKRSVSCYRGAPACGKCQACVTRRRAFAHSAVIERGIQDREDLRG